MIKDSLNALAGSARDAFRGWRGLLLLCALYLLLLACVYRFFAVRVNTWALAESAVLSSAAPLLLLVLLAATAHFALPEPKTAGALARRSLRDFWKVLLLAIPVAALGLLFFYLLGKLQQYLPKVEEAPGYVRATMDAKPAPLHWQEALLSSLRIIVFGLVLPLVAAHLWLSAARDGLKLTLKRIHRVAGRAFAPRSVLVYETGLFVFALVPYFALYTRTAVTNGWAELMLFGLRLAVVFLLTLLGWTITLGALARVTPAEPLTATVEPAAPPPAEAPSTEAPSAPPSSITEESAPPSAAAGEVA
jgi:hypothetical protein